MPEFASLGYLYSLDGSDLLEDNDYLATPLSSNKFNGKTYGVPQVTDTLALLYNKKLFEKAGVAGAQDLGRGEDAPPGVKAKTGNDGLYINPAATSCCRSSTARAATWSTPRPRRSWSTGPERRRITRPQDLVKSGAAVKPAANDSYGTMMTLFKESKVAMIINGPWEVANVDADPGSAASTTWASRRSRPAPPARVPRLAATTTSSTAGCPARRRQLAAVAFIKFMNSAESQAALAEKLGVLSDLASRRLRDRVGVKEQRRHLRLPVRSSRSAREPARGLPRVVSSSARSTRSPPRFWSRTRTPSKASLDAVAQKYKAEVVPSYATN